MQKTSQFLSSVAVGEGRTLPGGAAQATAEVCSRVHHVYMYICTVCESKYANALAHHGCVGIMLSALFYCVSADMLASWSSGGRAWAVAMC